MRSIPQPAPTLFDGKTCILCFQWKFLDQFHRRAASSDGRQYRCKVCARALRRDYIATHGRATQYHAEYREKHREQFNEYNRIYRQSSQGRVVQGAGKHRYIARKLGNGGSYTAEEWENLKAHYNYRCLRCDRREPDVRLTIDHILPISQGGANDIFNIQPLCGTCNSSKGTAHVDYRY